MGVGIYERKRTRYGSRRPASRVIPSGSTTRAWKQTFTWWRVPASTALDHSLFRDAETRFRAVVEMLKNSGVGRYARHEQDTGAIGGIAGLDRGLMPNSQRGGVSFLRHRLPTKALAVDPR